MVQSNPVTTAQGVTRRLPSTSVQWTQAVLMFLLVATCSYLAINGWFNPSRFTVLAGDDLRSFTEAKKGFGALSALMASVYRFRPVTTVAITFIAKRTHMNFHLIAVIGMAIHTVNALLFFFLLHRTIRLTAVVSFGLTVIAMLSRFDTYLFIQEEAITEGLGFVALFLIIIFALRLIEKPAPFRAWWITFFYLLIIHIHERYLVLACPLVALALFVFFANKRSGMVLGGGVLLVTLFNLAVKKFWFVTPILVGTNTHTIDFGLAQMALFYWWGLLNLIGISRGPSYLAIQDFAESPPWIQVVSVAAALLCCFLTLQALTTLFWWKIKAQRKSCVATGFLSVACLLLLLTSCVTIRQELRWVYSSYLVFLVLLAYGLSRNQRCVALTYMLAACFIGLSFVHEAYLSKFYLRYFGFQAAQVATAFYNTAKAVGVPPGTQKIVVRGTVDAAAWVFMGKEFSAMYHLPPLEFEPADSPVELANMRTVTLDYDSAKETFVPSPVVVSPETARHLSYSLLQMGTMNAPTKPQLGNPGQKPVFPMSFGGLPCLIATAPAHVIVGIPPSAQHLYLSFSAVYALGDGMNVELKATNDTGSKELLGKLISPLGRNNSPKWQSYELTIPPGTKHLDFDVFSGSGDGIADWLAVRDFSFE